MKRLIFGILMYGFVLANSVSAQSSLDVLRLSGQNLLGTARAAGTNTTMNGVGADFTTLSSNPAGIAQYRLSEIMVTPSVVDNRTKSRLADGSERPETSDSKTKFRLPNLGLVIAKQNSDRMSYAFGFGINGYVDNSQNSLFRGRSKGSIVERFAALANGLSLEQLDNYEAGLAWDTEALVQQRPDGSYSFDYEDYKDQELNKYQSISASNRYNDIAISGGINLNNKILVGASIGIPTFNYNERKIYQEQDDIGAVPYFDQLQFREYKSASGVGVNGKLGIIFKPINNILIGAAIHTPSFISVTDNFSTDLRYVFTFNSEKKNNYKESPEGTIDYKVTTPMRLLGSIGCIIGKFGFVNAEVEYQDYSGSKIRIDSDNLYDKQVEEQINGEIKANYTSTVKVNLGIEVAAIEHFRIRAGVGFAQTPFVGQRNFYPNFGLGLGYRSDVFFLDLGFRQWRSENGYQPYYITQASQTLVNNKLTNSAVLLTIGFKLR
ncbi:MAG: hypothetical protein IPI42_03940 [Saprospiraceae bacterium]|nr:hypothetical protein [Candidatus Parvibacillus calidus]